MAIVPNLHAQQGIHRHAKLFFYSYRQFGRYGRFAVYLVGQRRAADTQNLSSTGNRQTKFGQDFCTNKRAGVRRCHPNLNGFSCH